MATQAKIAQPENTLNWKMIWRGNAIINALFGDVLIFATSQTIDFTGMSSDMTTPLRLFGLICVMYAVWQLWASRHLTRTALLIGDGVETTVGLVSFGAIILGLQVNNSGSAALAGLGILAWLTAGVWFFASRQHLG